MTQPRRKILVLAPRLPFPLIGGDRIRIHGLCAELAPHFDLTLLSLCETEAEMRLPVPNDGIFQRVERVRLSRRSSYLNCLRAIPGRLPLQVAYYRSQEFANRIADLLPGHDAVLAHLIRTGDYIRDARIPKVLELTDSMALKYERIIHTQPKLGLMSFVYAAEEPRLRLYEREIIEDFDFSVVVSEVDKQFMVGTGARASRMLCCSNGVDGLALPYQFAPDGRTLALIGNMTSLHNLDAAWFFVEHILPIVRQHRPGATFKIIGRIDNRDAEKLGACEGVKVTGEVGSIAEAALGASVGVCPLRFGAGVQNKVLEYMSLGLPTVATPIGQEGLRVAAGRHLAVAESPEGFAAECIRLLENRAHAENLAKAARKYVETAHKWDGCLAPFVKKVYGLFPESPTTHPVRMRGMAATP